MRPPPRSVSALALTGGSWSCFLTLYSHSVSPAPTRIALIITFHFVSQSTALSVLFTRFDQSTFSAGRCPSSALILGTKY